jgi:hypothetical protein
MSDQVDLSKSVAVAFGRRGNADLSTYSDNDLVSEEYQNRLMFWRDTFRIGQFDIGDISVEIIVEIATRGIHVNHDRVFAAIGRYCGKSGRTVRYYYETAVFYDRDIRQRYSILPFSHFVFARTMGDKWQSVLDFALSCPGITADDLERRFTSAVINTAHSESESVPYSDQIDELVAADHKASDVSRSILGKVDRHTRIILFNGVYGGLLSIRPEIDRLGLSERLKSGLLDAIDTLMHELPEIIKSLSQPET